jgi:tRNA-Thr(GGU) m(6)t(6)A37 methyltransferase TsaA
VRSPFKEPEGTPIQPTAAKDTTGTIEIAEQFQDGLCDLEGFSHIIILYGFHLSKGHRLKVKPFLDDKLRGVFSTRAPKRPSQIGLSIVRLDKIEGTTLHITGVDMIDGTPVLDIKPYIPELNPKGKIEVGWLTNVCHEFSHKRADGRMS